MKTKDYITPFCECVQLCTDTSLLLITSAGLAGEAGLIKDFSEDFSYDI